MYKRFTKKRKGKNVIPLLNSVCGVDLPKWTLAVESDIRRYLSGDAVDKFAELEDKIENGTLVEQKQGKWLVEKMPNGEPYCFHCSICDREFMQILNKTKTNYCPDCGARMED